MAEIENSKDAVQLLHTGLFTPLVDKAFASERGRTNLNFHKNLSDNLHRFLNVMTRHTYFTPHRHLKPPKAEGFLVLKGKILVILFSEDGVIEAHHVLESIGDDLSSGKNFGIDLAPGCWHTIICLSKDAICYELKPGPYDVSDDKEFAPWAPHEGDRSCKSYQDSLLSQLGISYD